MSRMLSLASGRTAKWVVLAVWFVIAALSIGLQLPTKFADAEKNESTSFLPGDAESTKALAATKRLQGGEQVPMVAVFRREGGLTAADQQTIRTSVARFNARRAQLAAQGKDPFKRTAPFRPGARTKDAAIFTANIRAGTGKSETLLDPVNEARSIISDPGGGLQAKITDSSGKNQKNGLR